MSTSWKDQEGRTNRSLIKAREDRVGLAVTLVMLHNGLSRLSEQENALIGVALEDHCSGVFFKCSVCLRYKPSREQSCFNVEACGDCETGDSSGIDKIARGLATGESDGGCETLVR